jgi:hypothetical protein
MQQRLHASARRIPVKRKCVALSISMDRFRRRAGSISPVSVRSRSRAATRRADKRSRVERLAKWRAPRTCASAAAPGAEISVLISSA